MSPYTVVEAAAVSQSHLVVFDLAFSSGTCSDNTVKDTTALSMLHEHAYYKHCITDSFFPVLWHIPDYILSCTLLYVACCRQHSENWHRWWSSLFWVKHQAALLTKKFNPFWRYPFFPLFLKDGWWSKWQDFPKVGPVSCCTIQCFLWVLCYFKYLKSKSDSIPLNYISDISGLDSDLGGYVCVA
jgi:hypothetical protein